MVMKRSCSKVPGLKRLTEHPGRVGRAQHRLVEAVAVAPHFEGREEPGRPRWIGKVPAIRVEIDKLQESRHTARQIRVSRRHGRRGVHRFTGEALLDPAGDVADDSNHQMLRGGVPDLGDVGRPGARAGGAVSSTTNPTATSSSPTPSGSATDDPAIAWPQCGLPSYGGVVPDPSKIRWAPMLPTAKLIRLYEANAAGLLDDELLDDVGWRLWDRLSDVVRVTRGRVHCPDCRAEFQVRERNREPDQPVPCPTCGWSITSRAWHRSWEHRDLNGPCPEFEPFVDAWPNARTIRDRMLLIDGVVHALHVASRDDLPGNFAARNFLEGSRPKVVALLEELAHGPGSHVVEGARQRWSAARDVYRPASGTRSPR